jgi:hypothetical protein
MRVDSTQLSPAQLQHLFSERGADPGKWLIVELRDGEARLLATSEREQVARSLVAARGRSELVIQVPRADGASLSAGAASGGY